MRKIFSSRRLENAEAVAKLLRDDGIEVKIEHGRALHRAIRGNFSYLDSNSSTPESEVWVIRSDDQPRARALMREAGLLQDTTRKHDQPPPFTLTPRTQAQAKKRISRLRYGLLALALVLVVVNLMRPAADPPAATEPAPPRAALTMLEEAIVREDEHFVIATPPLLAAMLARRALDIASAQTVCLAIDGKDPAEIALRTLADGGISAYPASTCPSETALSIDIHRYTTDGSGAGTVLATHMGNTETLHVHRRGDIWSVL